MKKKLKALILLVGVFVITQGNPVWAAGLKVAVAANFTATAKMIATAYTEASGEKVTLAFGSTGKLYAQIKNGAPFEMFLAADARRPELLENEGVAVAGSRYTYALGKIVLWSADPTYVDPNGHALDRDDFNFIAIANPKLAPYGISSIETMKSRGVWEKLKGKVAQGENISQTYQYILSENAKMGFIAYSQIKIPGRPIKGSYWLVPSDIYQPIEQQLVILRDNENAWRFWSFIKSDQASKIIKSFGYGVQ